MWEQVEYRVQGMQKGARRQMGQVRRSSSLVREERRAAEGGLVLHVLAVGAEWGLAFQSRLESGASSDGTVPAAAAEEEAEEAEEARFFFAGGMMGRGRTEERPEQQRLVNGLR